MLVTTSHAPSRGQFAVQLPPAADRTDVRRAVLATVAYFDVQEMALTAWEVYRWLWRGSLEHDPGFSAVERELQQLVAAGTLVFQEGMYAYRGRERCIATRKERQAIAPRKWRRAQRMARLVAAMPFVRLVAVSNSLAWDNVRPDSDLDFFLVAKAGHVWTARFGATLLTAVLRRRPRAGHTADTVCLNFWTAEGTELRRVRLTEDVYFAYWFASLRPLYDAGGAARRLREANRWLGHSVNVQRGGCRRTDRRVALSRPVASGKRLAEAVAASPRVERWCERLQRAIMPRAIRDKELEPSSHVVLDATMLKFHVTDRRAEIRDKWRRRVREWNE